MTSPPSHDNCQLALEDFDAALATAVEVRESLPPPFNTSDMRKISTLPWSEHRSIAFQAASLEATHAVNLYIKLLKGKAAAKDRDKQSAEQTAALASRDEKNIIILFMFWLIFLIFLMSLILLLM